MTNKRYTAGAVVVGPKGLVVVVNQNGVSWSLPKGGIEKGETAQAAATREVMEETGITKLDFVDELGTYQRLRIGKGGKGEDKTDLIRVITIFLCATAQENLAPQDPDNPEARWVEPDKVSSLLTHPKDKEFYSNALPRVKKFITSHNFN
jgi:8-oxo-dGTP pyrophosphatase MutT (NUDIX family)